MERLTIEVGAFGVNCSILSENGRALVVDPGAEAPRIIDLLAKKGLEPAAILLTHAHFDHVGGVPGLQRTFPDLPVVVADADRAVITHPMNQYPPDYPAIPLPKNLTSSADAFSPFTVHFSLISTPGHTPGGVCYYFPDEKLLLSGDTLFCGSVGRTDLPGGDYATLAESLKKLKELPEDVVVVPGHGPVTTIGRELATNPFLR